MILLSKSYFPCILLFYKVTLLYACFTYCSTCLCTNYVWDYFIASHQLNYSHKFPYEFFYFEGACFVYCTVMSCTLIMNSFMVFNNSNLCTVIIGTCIRDTMAILQYAGYTISFNILYMMILNHNGQICEDLYQNTFVPLLEILRWYFC